MGRFGSMTDNLVKDRIRIQISFSSALGKIFYYLIHLVLQLSSLLRVDFQFLKYGY